MIQPELIEKYQILLEKDPRSKVFAPLAEAYRKLGLLKEAQEVAAQGVTHNPHFAGGRVALARAYMALDQYSKAGLELEKAVELSPDNALALGLLAECYDKAKDDVRALKYYKMLLFLNPNHSRAQTEVKRLENLFGTQKRNSVPGPNFTSQTQSESEILLEPDPTQVGKGSVEGHWRELDRYLSLADAYILRNDTERALATLDSARNFHGPHPQILQRIEQIRSRRSIPSEKPISKAPMASRPLQKEHKLHQIERLQRVLARVRSASERD